MSVYEDFKHKICEFNVQSVRLTVKSKSFPLSDDFSISKEEAKVKVCDPHTHKKDRARS